MIYSSWDIECDRLKLAILSLFCPFTPLKTKKSKVLIKWQKHYWRYHFTHMYQKFQSYDVWFLRYGVWRTEFFVILDHFLPFYHPNNPKNQKFWKNKKHLGYLFTHVHHKLWSHDVWFLKYGAWQTDGQMDGQEKWHIGVVAPPKKSEGSLFVLIKTHFRKSLCNFMLIITRKNLNLFK